MRMRSAIPVVGLVAAAVLLSGCCAFRCHRRPRCAHESESGGPGASGPWLRPGVVRVMRDGTVIAYAAPQPGNPAQWNWIVNGDENFPIDVAINGQVCFEYLNATSKTLDQLCTMYGSVLSAPKRHTVVSSIAHAGDCGGP